MTHRAHRDDLDDAWVRAGLTDPPPWGESLPDEWLDVELNFYRRTGGTTNNIGGFSGRGSALNYLVVNGKAEMETDTGVINSGGGGGTIVGAHTRRYYTIFIAIPEDHSLIPLKGDRVWWYDALNRRIDVGINSVDVPEGIADHIEIISEDIE